LPKWLSMLLCGGKWQLCSIPRCLRRQNGGVGAQGRVRHQSATLASRTAPVRARHANPSKAADLLMVRTPARAVSIRGRVLEAPRLCADPYHHGRRSCASPRASGSGSRSRPRLSDCHAALTRSNTVDGGSRDGSRHSRRGHGIATSAAAWEQHLTPRKP
jgi:hypothetical protein